MDTRVEMLTGQLEAELEVSALERPVIDPKSVPWRYSTLKEMSRSPLHYWWRCQDPTEDKLCFRIGAGTHAILFGQPYVKWSEVRRGKAWDEFKKEHADKPILNPKEYVTAQGIADSVRRNKDAVRYLLLDTRVEQRIDWTYLGRAFRSTPDAYGRHHVAELKSTRCADPKRFVKDGGWRGYHSQLATYREALIDKGVSTASEAYVIAVESVPPYPVTVFRVSDDTLERGARKLRVWAEQALACEQTGEYPAYTQSIAAFDLSEFDLDDADPFSLQINGEDVEL